MGPEDGLGELGRAELKGNVAVWKRGEIVATIDIGRRALEFCVRRRRVANDDGDLGQRGPGVTTQHDASEPMTTDRNGALLTVKQGQRREQSGAENDHQKPAHGRWTPTPEIRSRTLQIPSIASLHNAHYETLAGGVFRGESLYQALRNEIDAGYSGGWPGSDGVP